MSINTFIRSGNVIWFLGKIYRILAVKVDVVVLIELNIEKYHIVTVDFDYIMVAPKTSVYEVEDKYTPKQFALSIDQLERINEMATCFEAVLTEIFPDYEMLQSKRPVKQIPELAKHFNCTEKTIHKYMRRYLQSGRNIYSLVDQRKQNGKNVHAKGMIWKEKSLRQHMKYLKNVKLIRLQPHTNLCA